MAAATAGAYMRPARSGTEAQRIDALFRRVAEDRDQAARDALIISFTPLARRLASRYRTAQEPFDDLAQVATVGLIGAIDRFDPAHGAAFVSFAIPTILGELKRYFRTTGWSVHVPRGLQELSLRVDRTITAITRDLGRPPTPGQVAQHLEIDVEDVLCALETTRAHYATSLDTPVRAGDGETETTLIDELGAIDHGYGLIETKLSFAAAVCRLPYAERRALRLRIDHGLKQTEIADILQCSQMHVSRLLRRAAAGLQAMTDPDLTAIRS